MIINVEIEGEIFTLFYDYDYEKLSKLTEDGKIEWFRLRMNFVFLEPLKRIFDRSSIAHCELNSTQQRPEPARMFMIAAFSILLNGVEALGSFLISSNKNDKRFYAFIKEYMKDWDTIVQGTSYNTNQLKKILWKHFRNGIAHAFVIEKGGIEYEADFEKFRVKNGRLEVCPIAFFNDFLIGVNDFFDDIKSKHKSNFILRFKEAYPWEKQNGGYNPTKVENVS